MLLENETLEKFGYSINSLSKGTHKKICVKCDYCDSIYEVIYKQYNISHDVVDKDACKKCKYQKRADVSMKLYGVSNSAQRADVREKISENCAFKQDGFEEKRARTMMEKYGVLNASQNKELLEKQKQTIINRYGVENISQSEEIQAKKRATNKERYGNEQFLGSEIGREKIKQGMLEKYGVENPFQSEEIKQKIKQTNIDKFGFEHHFKDSDRAQEHGKRVLQSKIDKGLVKLYDGKPISEWLKESDYSDSAFRANINKYGFDVARTMSPQFSVLEQIFEKWLIGQGIQYKKQFAIGNKFADFFLPEYNIVIELDGLYWHSEKHKDDNYHIQKHYLYTSMGYKPFFFREDEIHNKFDIISSILNNAMNKSTKIFARKCEVIKPSKQDGKEFFKANHLMGKGGGNTYTLKYDNEIVSAMIIKRLKNKDYEISRFCHKLGYQVVGGFSRLITHFLQDNDVDLLTTFIDQRYGSGDYLKDLDFEFIGCEKSFRWTNSIECVHRLKFPGNSGYEKGFYKIWDCGQARYDMKVKKDVLS